MDFEDYAQASMIEILQSVGSFRGDASLEKWAERITVRTTMRLLRRNRRADVAVDLDQLPLRSELPGGMITELTRR